MSTSSEYDAFTLLDFHFEVTRYIEVFVEVITSFLFLRIFHTTIPVWLEYKFILLVELHVQIWITSIHTSLDTIVHYTIFTASCWVFVSILTYTAESQERTETQSSC